MGISDGYIKIIAIRPRKVFGISGRVCQPGKSNSTERFHE